MRERLLELAACALRGAFVTMALAWACSIWSPIPWNSLEAEHWPRSDDEVIPAERTRSWVRGAPEGFAARPDLITRYPRGLGVRETEMYAWNWPEAFLKWLESPDDTPVEADAELGTRHDELTVIEAGWPFLALRGGTWTAESAQPIVEDEGVAYFDDHWSLDGSVLVGAPITGEVRQLPLVPVWPAFITNTVFFGGFFYLLACRYRGSRGWIRKRAHRCRSCGYALGTAPVCSECGTITARRPRLRII